MKNQKKLNRVIWVTEDVSILVQDAMNTRYDGRGFKSRSDLIRFSINNYMKGKGRMPDDVWETKK